MSMIETMQQYAKSKGVICDIRKGKNAYQVWQNGELVFESQKAEDIGGFIDRKYLLKRFNKPQNEAQNG